MGAMSLLAWNRRGSGGNLSSSKVLHVAHFIASTKAHVIFISETRNSRLTKIALINGFDVDHAYIVPSQGLSGGLWLLWSQEVDVDVDSYSQNYILALCVYKQTI